MNNLEIKIAKKAGFCFGVQRAIELTEKAIKEDKEVYCWGDLVHNPGVMKGLQKKGLRIINDLEKLPERKVFIVRSHGMTLEDLEIVNKKKSKVINTTCPFVIKAQTLASKFKEAGKQILLLGDKNHIEVRGINSRAENQALIVNGIDDLFLIKNKLKGKIAVICQTTQKNSKLEEVVEKLKEWKNDFEVNNTICLDTTNKQKEVLELGEIDILIVLGGLHSSNTTKLAEIGKNKKVKTYHVEKAFDIFKSWFEGSERVFITAGASTPPSEIKKAKRVIENFCF